MKILAIHGFWRSGVFWKKATKVLQAFGHHVITPDLDWERDCVEYIMRMIRTERPDVIMGMNFGGYTVQKVLEKLDKREVRCCVLIAPVGPHGLGLRTFLKMCVKGPDHEIDDPELMEEKIINAWHALPFCGGVRKSISVPTLVISGGRDKFVSLGDALRIAVFHNASHMHWPELNHNELGKNRKVIQYIARWIAEK
ncbi:MAG: hypothetical protein HZC14_03585 [Candidatus Niyogibacteria bacterium]|nr:hypothetical protein [Candidatus Niyogibacteria bacterium]